MLNMKLQMRFHQRWAFQIINLLFKQNFIGTLIPRIIFQWPFFIINKYTKVCIIINYYSLDLSSVILCSSVFAAFKPHQAGGQHNTTTSVRFISRRSQYYTIILKHIIIMDLNII